MTPWNTAQSKILLAMIFVTGFVAGTFTGPYLVSRTIPNAALPAVGIVTSPPYQEDGGFYVRKMLDEAIKERFIIEAIQTNEGKTQTLASVFYPEREETQYAIIFVNSRAHTLEILAEFRTANPDVIWNPIENSVIFVSREDGVTFSCSELDAFQGVHTFEVQSHNIWYMNINRASEKQLLTTRETDDTMPRLSIDGTKVVYRSSDKSNSYLKVTDIINAENVVTYRDSIDSIGGWLYNDSIIVYGKSHEASSNFDKRCKSIGDGPNEELWYLNINDMTSTKILSIDKEKWSRIDRVGVHDDSRTVHFTLVGFGINPERVMRTIHINRYEE